MKKHKQFVNIFEPELEQQFMGQIDCYSFSVSNNRFLNRDYHNVWNKLRGEIFVQLWFPIKEHITDRIYREIKEIDNEEA